MIHRNRCDHRDERSYGIGRVQAPSHAGLKDNDIAPRTRKMIHRQNRREFEEGGFVFPVTAGLAQAREAGSGLAGGYHGAIHADAFTEIDKVRRGIEAGFVACGTEAGIQHGADGTLAVCACDMDEAQAFLGIPHGFEKPNCIFQAELDAGELGVVQPVQRFFKFHLVPR